MATTVNNNIRIGGATSPPPDYTLVSLWEDDIPASLVSVDEKWKAIVYDDWVSGLSDTVIFDGHICNPDTGNDITIEAAPGQGFTGDINSGVLITSTGTNILLNSNNQMVIVKDIRMISTATNLYNIYSARRGNRFSADKCYFKSARGLVDTASTPTDGYLTNSSTMTFNLIETFQSQAIDIENDKNIEIYNNTMYGSASYGINGASLTTKAKIKNNIAMDFSICFSIVGSENSNNASSDLTGDVTGITDSEFVDATAGNYHLIEASQLRGLGLNLITNPPNFPSPQYDIDGDQWPDSGAWDIGFDYFVGGAPAAGNIKLGLSAVDDIKRGSSAVDKVMRGTSQVWP